MRKDTNQEESLRQYKAIIKDLKFANESLLAKNTTLSQAVDGLLNTNKQREIVRPERAIEILEENLEEAKNAINQFCKESEWAAEVWKKQPHIAKLFDLRSDT